MSLNPQPWLVACAVLLGLCSSVRPAQANGRLPGATELAISRTSPEHLIARATYGLVQSFDRGASWQWICERAINVSGEVDPPVAVTQDGSMVLLPPASGALLSRDGGCSWEPAPSPLSESRAVDLTSDPMEPARVLVITSTVDTIDERGVVSYANLLIETRDNARTWSEVSRLPSSFFAETLELAASDTGRIYVGGTSSADPTLGILQRSEDGGKTWTESSVKLPPGSGSLFISAIHPSDPNRLWVRLPARGDRFGTLPVALMMSEDKGRSWTMLAATDSAAMLGFALSPDGARLAYGGPGDGLFIGASDGHEGFERLSDLRVRCLRWNADGLYACGTEATGSLRSGDPFSLGVSTNEGASFRPIYSLADTCPQACPNSAEFEQTCMTAWTALAPSLDPSSKTCTVSWSRPANDTGSSGEGVPDAGAPDAGLHDALSPDAGARGESAGELRSTSSCSITSGVDRSRGAAGPGMLALLLLAAWAGRRHRACVTLVVALATIAPLGCSDDGDSSTSAHESADAATFVPCPDSIPEFAAGATFTGRDGHLQVKLVEASHIPARKYRNDWVLEVTDAGGEPVADVRILRLEAFMPVHGHFSRPPAEVDPLATPGQVNVTIHFIMRGPWEVQIELMSKSVGADYAVMNVCVEE